MKNGVKSLGEANMTKVILFNKHLKVDILLLGYTQILKIMILMSI